MFWHLYSQEVKKTQYKLYRRLCGPQHQSTILPPPGFNPWTVQPIASHYTDYASDDKKKLYNPYQDPRSDSMTSIKMVKYVHIAFIKQVLIMTAFTSISRYRKTEQVTQLD